MNLSFNFFLYGTGIELRLSNMLGKYSATCYIPNPEIEHFLISFLLSFGFSFCKLAYLSVHPFLFCSFCLSLLPVTQLMDFPSLIMKWVIFARWVSWRSNFEGPFVITAFLAGTEAAHVSTSQIGNAHVCAYVWRQHMHRPARDRKYTYVCICVETAHAARDRKCICVCLCVCAVYLLASLLL